MRRDGWPSGGSTTPTHQFAPGGRTALLGLYDASPAYPSQLDNTSDDEWPVITLTIESREVNSGDYWKRKRGHSQCYSSRRRRSRQCRESLQAALVDGSRPGKQVEKGQQDQIKSRLLSHKRFGNWAYNILILLNITPAQMPPNAGTLSPPNRCQSTSLRPAPGPSPTPGPRPCTHWTCATDERQTWTAYTRKRIPLTSQCKRSPAAPAHHL